MKVLVVEDDPVSQKVLSSLVSKVAQCAVASDGEEAFDKYCDAVESDAPFDLIFLDVMMPEVDGQQVLAAIRQYESDLGIGMSEGVPVVMTTALDDGQNIYEAHANGCSNYLVKPITKDKIMKIFAALERDFEQ